VTANKSSATSYQIFVAGVRSTTSVFAHDALEVETEPEPDSSLLMVWMDAMFR
jgi:hypothetical protein